MSNRTFGDQGQSPDASHQQQIFQNLCRHGVVLGLFYLSGLWINRYNINHSTMLFLIALLLSNVRAIYTSAMSTELVPAYYYIVGVVCLQLGVASLPNRTLPQQPQTGPDSSRPPLRPMLLPCKTTHTRFFPKKHSFQYTYLLVGIPIPWEGKAGTLLSAGAAFEKTTWFSVSADDYLARGRHADELTGKLKDYLSSQNVPADRYAYAYLVTAPRLLGFSFNPVSFWYLYDNGGKLGAMILEVNNTFDERRMYYMQGDRKGNKAAPLSFTDSWSKDFHVSPFNDRDGSYSLTARDVRADLDHMAIDNNIALLSESGKVKIVARVFSTDHGTDPETLSTIASWLFLMRWWWVGFVTNLRILREARVLWVKGLQVFYRPEVFKSSIGRNESADEQQIERHFRQFLQRLVDCHSAPITISYHPAAGSDRGRSVRLDSAQGRLPGSTGSQIELHVLTPAFYSELVKADSIVSAFSRAAFEPVQGEAMLHVSDHNVARELLEEFETKREGVSPPLGTRFSISSSRLGYFLATAKLNLAINLSGNRGKTRLSEFDNFVRDSSLPALYEAYIQIVARTLLTDRLAFGFGWLFSVYRELVRAIMIYWTFPNTIQPGLPWSSAGGLLRLLGQIAVYHCADALITV